MKGQLAYYSLLSFFHSIFSMDAPITAITADKHG
jgi:hypothetical protein